MKIDLRDDEGSQVYVELTREHSPDHTSTWVRLRVGYEGNPPVINTGISNMEARSLSYALRAITTF